MTDQTIVDSMPGLTIMLLFFNTDNQFHSAGKLSRGCKSQGAFRLSIAAYNTRGRMLSDEEVPAVNKFIIEIVKQAGIDVYGHPYIFSRKALNIWNKSLVWMSTVYPCYTLNAIMVLMNLSLF